MTYTASFISSNSSFVGCVWGSWDILCPLVCVMFGLTILTTLAVIAATCRIGILTKRKLSHQMSIHYCVLFQSLVLLVYYSIYDEHWVRSLFELLKISTFVMVGYFFTRSAFRLRVLPPAFSERCIYGGFFFFFFFVVVNTALMVYWGYSPKSPYYGCRNIGRITLAGSQFVFALFFGIISFLIFQLLKTVDPSDTTSAYPSTTINATEKTRISSSFIMKHTRPLQIVLVIYTWCSISNLVVQIYLNYESDANESCHSVLLRQHEIHEWFFWLYPIIRQIDLIVPLWAILWYFLQTVQKTDTKAINGDTPFLKPSSSYYSIPPPTTKYRSYETTPAPSNPSQRLN
eukprot:TRINITY_DN7560_c0_g1_i3.p1 TRINITY_DN7560_c0_g1~~TRINITY_DN7560_c0_g1_i3.p1  ORF type:complete len:345 (-),score=23.77 TRINITY_DN7560_c0_g1_i3:98-1132(-)